MNKPPAAGDESPPPDTSASAVTEDDFADLEAALADEPDAAGMLQQAPAAPAPKPTARVADDNSAAWSTRDPEDRIAHLARVNMFAGLTPAYLRRIASLCEEETHMRGTFLFKEGDLGDKLYVITHGAVRIARQISGMGEEALAVLRTGDYFGEMSLIDTFPRSADAYAHEDCRVLVIDKQKLEDLLFVDRDLAYDLLWNFVRTLSGRLRQTNDKMTFLAVTNKF